MTGLRLATVATVLLLSSLHITPASAQVVFTTGEGVCRLCGHSELDTQRYVNSFLNQLFFPQSVTRRASIAASLYALTATYTMYGSLSPDPQFSRVTIAITAEVRNALPTGNYHVTVTTPGGKTHKDTYAIGSEQFSVRHEYEPGARRKKSARKEGAGGSGGSGSGGRTRTEPFGYTPRPYEPRRRPAKCSRSRLEERGNNTILFCSVD